MTSERAPYLGLCALALGLSAIAALFREWWIVAGALGLCLFQLYNLTNPPVGLPSGQHIIKLLGMGWTLDEFLTHWVVVGRSGSGKTAGVIRTLFIQLMHSVPNFGCIAIDEKANFYKLLVRICKANGQPDKLIVLRPHRPGAHRELPTPYTMSLIG